MLPVQDGAAARLAADRYWRLVKVSQPAAGVDWSVTAPGEESWEVLSVLAQLLTSAVVGTRVAGLELADPDSRYMRLPPGAGQAASLTAVYQLVTGGPAAAAAAPAASVWGGPARLYVPQGHLLRTATAALDAGDQWSEIRVAVIATKVRGGVSAAQVEAEQLRRAGDDLAVAGVPLDGRTAYDARRLGGP